MESDVSADDESASVVVPAIDAPSSVACLRSLGRRGVRTVVVSETPTAPAVHSAYCDEVVPVPAPQDDLLGYRDALLDLARRDAVHAIVPVREADVYVLSRYREQFAAEIEPLWPAPDTLRRVQDRCTLFEAAETAGIDAPETHLVGEVDDPGREWIVKPRYSILADAYVDCDPADCTAPPTTTYLPPGTEPDVAALTAEMGHEPICQEYVHTPHEYGFFALYDEGEPVATFQHRQRRGYSYAGGPSAFRESVDISALETAGLALLDELDWHGLAMVEFLRDEETGEFKLMEINPRFWSSLPFTVQAGVDFPYYYWQLCNGGGEIAPAYDVGVAGHLLRGELLYLHSILADDVDLVDRPSFPAAVGSVARSLVSHPRFDYLQKDDIRPFVQDLRNAVGSLRTR
ncbi:ATP-grasp protein-like protein [Halovivax asiaticus JCM 14624]|uniref:ATP-grasp protein-like protein n=1 Tax=Halovivax asiaticus JCM 14624 TaxID=1227490 RepID=M0BER0_9EURY|nr:ATP-grasp protein [Halovivax asiaticus]ELZ09330.1 ATP-grasp protein-like protein [Halovivax asiaticus JCM 14624]